MRLPICVVVFAALIISYRASSQNVGRWMRFEKVFSSSQDYNNPLYDLKFKVRFVSPSGKIKTVDGFWDGQRSWRVRFMPDEQGEWKWTTESSDRENSGLNNQRGAFNCIDHNNPHAIYRKGAITRTQGLYHLQHAEGTPFFWTACTAWNGTLKSTDEEWAYYLNDRAANHYNVIQFVTTQWRGGDKNSLGQVAFEGSGLIKINPEFFQHLDKKIDQINDAGLVAAPVLLWALQTSQGRHLSPGYFLPEPEAILLARYMVARYGAHHVVWILGGDGKYTDQFEQRWKNIGRGVFGGEHPGLVALHPGGKSWVGEAYADEAWLDIVGYQTGHDNGEATVRWATKGPVAKEWKNLPPKIFINMEPVYEEIRQDISAKDIRNAVYWSILSTPTSGITYGANGIWPWLRQGEEILNHAGKGAHASRWKQSLSLPGSRQVGFLSQIMQTLEWWKLKPAPELLLNQPGDSVASHFVSVSRSDDRTLIVAYLPYPREMLIHNPEGDQYDAQWFDPVSNKTMSASLSQTASVLYVDAPTGNGDHLLVLKRRDPERKARRNR